MPFPQFLFLFWREIWQISDNLSERSNFENKKGEEEEALEQTHPSHLKVISPLLVSSMTWLTSCVFVVFVPQKHGAWERRRQSCGVAVESSRIVGILFDYLEQFFFFLILPQS